MGLTPHLTRRNMRKMVSQDCAPATVCGRHKPAVRTWNIRAFHQYGKFENSNEEMNRLNIIIMEHMKLGWKIMEISETTDTYAGGEKNERGTGLILNQNMEKSVLGYCQLSKAILLVKLKCEEV